MFVYMSRWYYLICSMVSYNSKLSRLTRFSLLKVLFLKVSCMKPRYIGMNAEVSRTLKLRQSFFRSSSVILKAGLGLWGTGVGAKVGDFSAAVPFPAGRNFKDRSLVLMENVALYYTVNSWPLELRCSWCHTQYLHNLL